MPIATTTKNKMMLYVRERLHIGLEPDAEGWYVIRRSEFINDIPMNASTFDRVIKEWIQYDLSRYSLSCAFNFKIGFKEDQMFLDACYTRGKLMFRRNPVTFLPELERVWTGSVGGWNVVHSIYQYIPELVVPPNYVLPYGF